jgi:hypothetical protein
MSSPLYEKVIARHDYISIDGTDYSNAFNEFRVTSEHSEEDVSGYSETGVDETLPGRTAQGFEGTFFLSSGVSSAFWEMHIARDVVVIEYQPNGLVDNTGPLWKGNCTVFTVQQGTTRGSAATSPFSAKAADADGIHMVNT